MPKPERHIARSAPTAPTLHEIYSAHLAAVRRDPSAPHATDLGEERGWLLRAGIPDIVQPFLTHLPADALDLAQYAGLDGAAAAALLKRLGPVQLLDRQNQAPSIGTVLRAAANHPDDVEVHGYLVGPGRPDERITAEGVDVYGAEDLMIAPDHPRGCECRLLWQMVAEEFGIDDAVSGPHEITAHVNPWRPNEPCWRLWWD
jgi:hypothetical protein